MGLEFSKITCSAQKRAVLSAKYFREGYSEISNKNPEI